MSHINIDEQKKYKLNRNLLRGIAYIFLIIMAIVSFFPFYVMVISATHDNFSITTQVNFLPGGDLLENYERLISKINLWKGFFNSAFVAISSTLIGVYFTTMTAYAFSKFEFKFKKPLFTVVLVSMMIPGQLGVIGFYREMTNLHLLNTYLPLIIPSAANCFSVFFIKQYMDGGIPNEIIEAAHCDGCSEIRLFHTIIIPIVFPALVIQGIMSFIGNWNSYMTPLIILNQTDKLTLPVLLSSLNSTFSADYAAQYVGILISVIPLILIFSFTSKMIMDNVSIGSAVKG